MIKCPKCQTELRSSYTVDLTAESRFSFKLAPKPGHLMQARTIGETLVALQNVLSSIGESINAETEVLVDKVDQNKDGEISFHFIVARVVKAGIPATQEPTDE